MVVVVAAMVVRLGRYKSDTGKREKKNERKLCYVHNRDRLETRTSMSMTAIVEIIMIALMMMMLKLSRDEVGLR